MIQWLQKISFLCCITIIVNGFSSDGSSSINPIREKFFDASYDKEAFFELSELIDQFGQHSSVELEAYSIASDVLSAKYIGNPYEKVQLVYSGLSRMNKLIVHNGDNIELRFLRFALEYHIPAVLMIKRHLEVDQTFIIENILNVKDLQLSEKFGNTLLGFMEETGYFSELEKSILKENLFK